MSLAIDPDDRPTPAELTPNVPMWLSLRVCECGRFGTWGVTRCGKDGRHNMDAVCPTVEVSYVPADEAP